MRTSRILFALLLPLLTLAFVPATAHAFEPSFRLVPDLQLTPDDPGPEEPPERPTFDPGGPIAIQVRSTIATGRADDHIVVRFTAGVPGWQQEAIAAGLGSPRLTRPRAGQWVRVDVPPGETPEQLAERFRDHPSVAWAETDGLVRATYDGRVVAAAATDDPFFTQQWHMQRIGLDEALSRNPVAGGGVIVAVLDGGVAFGNGATFPFRRGVDLAATPFAPGFDFVDRDDQPFDEGSAADPARPNQTIRFGHGTFAASIIAATANNRVAGTGVAPRATILPVRVLGTNGSGTFSGVAEGITFAADSGARVINMSLGGVGGSQALAEAVADAHRRGAVLVAAAGNEANDPEFEEDLDEDVAFPARYPQVIAVGATTFSDARAGYSNFGPSLDLMAPGGGNNQMVGDGILDGVLATSFLFDPVSGQSIYGGFWSTGTSWAAPHVAGLAALLISLGVDDPDAVRVMLELTSRDLFAPGFDTTSGHGLIDAASAHRGLGLTN